jgi:hypothetical protein
MDSKSTSENGRTDAVSSVKSESSKYLDEVDQKTATFLSNLQGGSRIPEALQILANLPEGTWYRIKDQKIGGSLKRYCNKTGNSSIEIKCSKGIYFVRKKRTNGATSP